MRYGRLTNRRVSCKRQLSHRVRQKWKTRLYQVWIRVFSIGKHLSFLSILVQSSTSVFFLLLLLWFFFVQCWKYYRFLIQTNTSSSLMHFMCINLTENCFPNETPVLDTLITFNEVCSGRGRCANVSSAPSLTVRAPLSSTEFEIYNWIIDFTCAKRLSDIYARSVYTTAGYLCCNVTSKITWFSKFIIDLRCNAAPRCRSLQRHC